MIVPLFFFLFTNTQTVSAVTCCTNPLDQSTCFQVASTCFSDSGCAGNEKCDYGGAWCGWPFTTGPPALGGPCKPLNCIDCKVAQNNECVSQPRPSSTPNCCSYSCVEGGLATSYSASLFDQTCYSLTNIQNDVNNCGTCGNKCTGGKVCTSGSCACPDGQKWDSNQNKCVSPPVPTQCPDGTLEGACCTDPGTKCKNDGTGTLKCLTDTSCPSCYDTDTANDPKVKGVAMIL